MQNKWINQFYLQYKDNFMFLARQLVFGSFSIGVALFCNKTPGFKDTPLDTNIIERRDLSLKVIYETSPYGGNQIDLYKHNWFGQGRGLVSLRDYNKDNIVDEIFFSNHPLTGTYLKINREDKPINSQFFQKVDSIYQKNKNKN